jgi:phenylpropionate dioxygenase-like ring-hydroxylating dioxygenase large terminal subunit
MAFVNNLWYVAAWSHEVAQQPLGVCIVDEPIVLYRRADGTVVALEDRCPHRHAPLSLGRVEGDDIRCMYHGLRFGCDGVCKEVPGTDTIPPRAIARSFPVVERSSWIWVWTGDPAKADPARVPTAFGLDNPEWVMRSGALDYEADYQLLNDNLCDLSHLDFVHEATLGWSTGAKWSTAQPTIRPLDDGLLFERWFLDHPQAPGRSERVDTWNSYRYLLPGVFLMTTQAYPVGTARDSEFGEPTNNAKPVFRRVEQQAVTPISEGRSRYLYASGVEARIATPQLIDGMFAVINASFAEDRRMIEAQQRLWNRTPADRKKAFIVQDKAPAMFRRLIERRIADER